jgi:Abnormal spindle-like microcephaly-assoc'd, ASPM-SPD-2-Hydin/Cep192 domain 4/HYDIN/CFA65/VesB-like, Ig-like domain
MKSRTHNQLMSRKNSRGGVFAFVAICMVIVASVALSSCAGYTSVAQSTGGGQTGNSGSGVLTPSSTSVAFGNVAVGSTVTQTVSVTNTGTATVNITGASITGAGFTMVSGSGATSVPVGQSASLQVQFAPTSEGNDSATLTVTSDASNSPVAVSFSGTGTEAIMALAPASLNFNNVTVGQKSSQNVTITNNGNSNLTFTSATISGTGFTMSGLSPLPTIPAGQSATFSVQFTPTSTAGATGNVTFRDNAAGSPQTLTLTGSAVAAGSTLTPNPGSVNFGNVVVGTSSAPQTITLTNSGNAAITINGVSTTGSGFSTSGLSTGQQIAAGGTANFTVSFAPTATGTVPGNITITSTATNGSISIPLSGTGTQGALNANPSSVNFGNLLVGANASIGVTLSNPGTAAVSITGSSITGASFSMSALSPQTLNPGQTASFNVTFTPTASGAASGTVSITSNAPGSPLKIALSGTGVATQALLTINPTPVAFGNVNVNGSANQTVTLTNPGNATLNITAASITGASYTMTLAPTSINAGANTTFTVTFAPTSAGSAPGSISITSNAPNSPATIALSGTGTQPQISANPTSVSFGTVTVGNSNSQPITLKNNGNATLTFSQITVAGTGFSQSGLSTSTTIAAGGTTSFNAVFTPSSATAVTGSITLTTNGTPSPLVINLSGTGSAATFLIGANPTSLSFGSVSDGSNSSLTTSITNNGNSNITISSVTVTGAGFSASGISNGTQLTPGQSATLTVTFAPTTAGTVSGASVSVASNATNSPTTISLSGTGTHTVLLQWTASTTAGVTYNVFRGTSKGGEGTSPINSSAISGTAYTDTNVTSGQSYFYTVEAVNSGGSSTASNEAQANIP